MYQKVKECRPGTGMRMLIITPLNIQIRQVTLHGLFQVPSGQQSEAL